MTDIAPYNGPERRRAQQIVDDAKLEEAMAEVRKLHGRTTELAEAVSRTVPKQEVEARERQFRYMLVGLAIASLVCMIMIPLITRMMLVNRFDRIDAGQRISQCLSTKAEAERTGSAADTALLTCTQKVNR